MIKDLLYKKRKNGLSKHT